MIFKAGAIRIVLPKVAWYTTHTGGIEVFFGGEEDPLNLHIKWLEEFEAAMDETYPPKLAPGHYYHKLPDA